MEENFLKLTHVQRQEAAQSRREEKKRAEKERIMNEEDPEKQRRLEVRQTPGALPAGLGFSIQWFLCFETISFPPSLSSLPNLPYINSFPQLSFKFMASFSLFLCCCDLCACVHVLTL